MPFSKLPSLRRLRVAVSMLALTAASVSYATQAGSTSSGEALAGQDFQPASGQVNFLPLQDKQTVMVTVIGNNSTDGTTKKVHLNLSNPSGATMPGGMTAVGDITNYTLN